MEILVKRVVNAGEAIFSNDVIDVRSLRFPAVSFSDADKVLYCFRVGWKFGLFFDFGNNRKFNVEAMQFEIGHCYRTLRYQSLYDALGDEKTFQHLVSEGWFPFLELTKSDFQILVALSSAELPLTSEETKIVNRFTDERIDAISARWFRKEVFSKRRDVIQSGLNAFKRTDSVACLKILLTEIEGILRDAHISTVGSSAKITDLLEFAISEGIKKAGTEASLFFPMQFARYLRDFTFANFDPMNPLGAHASRHSVGHGGASPNAYTQTRALQAILTIDQLAFFL
jgi:hypothetical protein